MFTQKTVILIDSLENAEVERRFDEFYNLLALAMISATIAGEAFDHTQWACVFSEDCPKQTNTYD